MLGEGEVGEVGSRAGTAFWMVTEVLRAPDFSSSMAYSAMLSAMLSAISLASAGNSDVAATLTCGVSVGLVAVTIASRAVEEYGRSRVSRVASTTSGAVTSTGYVAARFSANWAAW